MVLSYLPLGSVREVRTTYDTLSSNLVTQVPFRETLCMQEPPGPSAGSDMWYPFLLAILIEQYHGVKLKVRVIL
jgi:hypothetical protein